MQNIPYIMDDYLWSREIKIKKTVQTHENICLNQWMRFSKCTLYKCQKIEDLCLRQYHVENTGSCPITEVKQRRDRLVLVGDRLGIPGAVDFVFYLFFIIYILSLLLSCFLFSFFLFDSILFLLFLYK